jgi:Transcriptional regulator, AbiEi antitoxin
MADGYAAHPHDWPVDLQAGVLTRAQALAAGLTDRAIANRLRRGRWQRLYPGVYATFSGAPAPECRLWAAILRTGPSSALSHQTAARLWDLSGAAATAIHVTVPRGSPVAPAPGVVIHYSQRVTQARHPTALPPRTTVEETALDLAGAARSAEDAVAWVLGAVASRRTTAERLSAALRQRRRIRWRAEIGYALDPVNAGVHSILEFRFVNRVERPHGLPAGTRQRPVRRGRGQRGQRREYADTAYEEYATLVELDGRAAHPESSRHLDTNRDNANIADGWVTLRYGWVEVSEHSCEVAAQLAQALRRRGWTGSPRRCSARCRIPPADLPAAQPPPAAARPAPVRPAPARARPAPVRPAPARAAPARAAPARATPADPPR